MIPILVTRVAADQVEVLTPYNQQISSAQGYEVYPSASAGLTGNLFVIEGVVGDTLILQLKGCDNELTFKI